MTAEDARKLNDAYADKQQMDIPSIENRIRAAAEQGKSSVSISLLNLDGSYRNRVYEKTAKYFQDNGFQIKRNIYSDQRDAPATI